MQIVNPLPSSKPLEQKRIEVGMILQEPILHGAGYLKPHDFDCDGETFTVENVGETTKSQGMTGVWIVVRCVACGQKCELFKTPIRW